MKIGKIKEKKGQRYQRWPQGFFLIYSMEKWWMLKKTEGKTGF